MKDRFRIRFLLIGLSFLGVPLFAADNNPNPGEFSVRNLIPSSGVIPGWRRVEGPAFYNPDTLFEIVDGAAPFYLNLGFRELAHARYQDSQDETRNITLDIYDQGTVEGGFGVYSSSRHSDESFQKWGTQGYRSGPLAILWKGRFYISLMGDDERPETLQGLEAFAAWINGRLPGEDVYPELIDRLPPKNRIPNTELYVSEKYLGYRFLSNIASAQYCVLSSTATLFVAHYSTPEQVKSILDQVRKEIGKEEPLPDVSSPPPTAAAYACADKYLGHMIFLSIGQYLYGVFDPEVQIPSQTLFEVVTSILKESP